jgi:hypothetical protein
MAINTEVVNIPIFVKLFLSYNSDFSIILNHHFKVFVLPADVELLKLHFPQSHIIIIIIIIIIIHLWKMWRVF